VHPSAEPGELLHDRVPAIGHQHTYMRVNVSALVQTK
jgi:hypothetical protein